MAVTYELRRLENVLNIGAMAQEVRLLASWVGERSFFALAEEVESVVEEERDDGGADFISRAAPFRTPPRTRFEDPSKRVAGRAGGNSLEACCLCVVLHISTASSHNCSTFGARGPLEGSAGQLDAQTALSLRLLKVRYRSSNFYVQQDASRLAIPTNSTARPHELQQPRPLLLRIAPPNKSREMRGSHVTDPDGPGLNAEDPLTHSLHIALNQRRVRGSRWIWSTKTSTSVSPGSSKPDWSQGVCFCPGELEQRRVIPAQSDVLSYRELTGSEFP